MAAIASTRAAKTLAASLGKSAALSGKRCSKTMFWPGTQPSFAEACF
jgi:hypothetical protein